MQENLTEYRKNYSDIYSSLASPVNATNTSRFENTCFVKAGKYETCFKMECLAEAWGFEA